MTEIWQPHTRGCCKTPIPAVHEPAAKAWCEWEDTHVATYAGHQPSPRYEDPRFRLGFARLVTHYWSNAAFLDDDQLFRDADRIADIPVLMVHGRLDISGPTACPGGCRRSCPDPSWLLIGDEGHGGGTVDVRRHRRVDRSGWQS